MSYPGGEQFDPYSGEPVPHQYGGEPVHQYGGGSTYRGLGAFDEPPRPNRKPLVLAVVAVLVVAGAAVGAYFLSASGDDDGENPQAVPPPVRTSSSAPPSTSSSQPETTTPTDLKADPVVDGWQVAISPKEAVAYDVSDDWTVESPDTLTGFEDGNGRQVIMHGVSTYRSDFCKADDGSYRGEAGFMTAGDADPKKVPAVAVKLWATAAAELPKDSDKVQAGAVKPVDIEGGQQAWMSTTTVRNPVKSVCAPDVLKVTAVAFVPREGGDTALFIMHTDTDVDDELPAADAQKVIGSLRPTGSD